MRHPINKKCPHCNNRIELEEGHSCWICPICRKFISNEPGGKDGDISTNR